MANPNSAFDQLEDYFRRLLRLVTVLVDTHLDIAVQEASYESRRLIGGFVMLGLGILMLVTVVVLAQVAAVVFAQAQGLSWLQAIAVVAGINLGLGFIFLAAARLRLRGPLMTQTQARLARSMALLKARD